MPRGRVFTVAADVTQTNGVSDLMAAIVVRFGQADVLLNVAGGWSGGETVAETFVEEWSHMLALNLHSAFLFSRAVLPAVLEARWGRIAHASPSRPPTPSPRWG